MRYVVSGRLREPCGLSRAEHFTLAVREWEVVLGWMACGMAVGYGRLGAAGTGTIVLEVASEAEASALARALPFAPYADLSIARVHETGPRGHAVAALLGGAAPSRAPGPSG